MKADGKGAAFQEGLAGWLLARWRGRGRTQPRLALLEKITLAPRQTLCLVEAEGRQVLVATSPEGAAFYPLDGRNGAGEGRKADARRRASW